MRIYIYKTHVIENIKLSSKKKTKIIARIKAFVV